MLVLYTDFGSRGPYVGQMKAALASYAPGVPVVDLCHDLIPFDAQAAAYLLAALVKDFPADSVFVGVVDPGVGGDRDGLIVRADGRYFVGPDNGLFDRVAARAETKAKGWKIFWRPQTVSASFHGRDIFAPVAAMLAAGTASADELGEAQDFSPREWPDDLARVVYIDAYGNAITGIRFSSLGRAVPVLQGETLELARTFSDLAPGEGFYYRNSMGLVEIAVNRGSAALRYGLSPGDPLELADAETALGEIRVR